MTKKVIRKEAKRTAKNLARRDMTCDSCHLIKPIDHAYCPFARDVYNKHVPMKLCNECFQDKCNGI